QAGARSALCEVWAKGGAGGEALAAQVLEVMDGQKAALRFTYPDEMPLAKKIEAIATRVYGARSVRFEPGVRSALKKMESEGAAGAPVCIAKTQYSFTDNPKKLGAPEDFELAIRSVKRSSGAGFVVAFAGDIIAMPGLPAQPAAAQMDVDAQGHITGLF
nr:formate--tetrahydrofolate ligase [Clostridia bacterium]